jgi:hypothetical protein
VNYIVVARPINTGKSIAKGSTVYRAKSGRDYKMKETESMPRAEWGRALRGHSPEVFVLKSFVFLECFVIVL